MPPTRELNLEEEQPPRLTLLLRRMQQGDRKAGDEAIALVHGHLRRIAAQKMRGERRGHTLQPTALVHEAYLRLVKNRELKIADRKHFFRLAAMKMGHVLIDHAKKRQGTIEQGGRVDSEALQIPSTAPALDLDEREIREALGKLRAFNSRWAQVFELRFFNKYTLERTASELDISRSQAQRDWKDAIAWISQWVQHRASFGSNG